eukprot:scaffold100_cov323-Pavlova_lutheri.AAC.19
MHLSASSDHRWRSSEGRDAMQSRWRGARDASDGGRRTGRSEVNPRVNFRGDTVVVGHVCTWNVCGMWRRPGETNTRHEGWPQRCGGRDTRGKVKGGKRGVFGEAEIRCEVPWCGHGASGKQKHTCIHGIRMCEDHHGETFTRRIRSVEIVFERGPPRVRVSNGDCMTMGRDPDHRAQARDGTSSSIHDDVRPSPKHSGTHENTKRSRG